jgi:hypothetical protein
MEYYHHFNTVYFGGSYLTNNSLNCYWDEWCLYPRWQCRRELYAIPLPDQYDSGTRCDPCCSGYCTYGSQVLRNSSSFRIRHLYDHPNHLRHHSCLHIYCNIHECDHTLDCAWTIGGENLICKQKRICIKEKQEAADSKEWMVRKTGGDKPEGVSTVFSRYKTHSTVVRNVAMRIVTHKFLGGYPCFIKQNISTISIGVHCCS